jgi:phage anti-repressor protein
MNSLIQITKNTINGSEINSVNARETYEYLGLAKGQFSRWIKSAIDKYDFVQNEDYITIDTDVEGIKDYIVSLDMAKELCLVSNTPKGKETRKYFINFEKQYQRPLTINEQIILIAQGHQEVNQRLTEIENKIENDITLTSAQKYHLKELVTKKVFEIKNNHNFDDSFAKKTYQRIWKKLKKHFIVSSYMEIPKSKFDEAVEIVKNVSLGDLI